MTNAALCKIPQVEIAIAYSRGNGRHDNTPTQHVADDADAFIAAVLADRQPRKDAGWIAAPFAVAPDDELHRASPSMHRAIGKPHRLATLALPRQFIGLDVDGGLDAESFSALVLIAHQWHGAIYTTASSKPDAMRCRILVTLDMPAPRAELIAASVALRARIDAAMKADGHNAPKWDTACDRPEQPLFLPTETSQTFTLEGEPACLAELLADPAAVALLTGPGREPDTSRGHVAAENRHADLLKFSAQAVRRAALADVQAAAAAGRWSRDLEHGEAERAVDGALAKLASGEWSLPATGAPAPPAANDADAQTLRVVEVGDLSAANVKAPSFVVAQYLPRGVVTAINSPGGLGKTGLTLGFLTHVSAGRPFGPFEVEQGKTIFVSLEDESDQIRFQLRNVVEAFELDAGEVAKNLRILDGASGDVALAHESPEYGAQELIPDPALAQLDELAAGVSLIAIDGVGDALRGNINDPVIVRDFIRRKLGGIAKKHDCAILLIGHVDKAGARNGTGGQSFLGSVEFHNSTRSRLALSERDGCMWLDHEKANRSAKAEPLRLRRSPMGVLMPAGIDPVAGQVDAADADAMLAALRAAEAAGFNVPPGRIGAATAFSALGTLRELPASMKGARGKARFWRALDALLRDGRATCAEYKTPDRKTRTRIVAERAE